MHILIVDDELDFLEIMEARLGKRGIHVTTASSGEEALKLLQTHAFNAVILDVKMPGMDGIETLKLLKLQKPTLGVLLLTGHANIDSAITGVEAGAADYLIKPVPMNDLIVRLHEIASSDPKK